AVAAAGGGLLRGVHADMVRAGLDGVGLAGRARYVERATMASQRIVPLAEVDPMASPYFSLLVVPGEKWQG
ncbi:precorrin-2 C(20)-methyltransferase, partial [Burkholderia gladioli]|nr:precorrin-2 C(20)-methyltransferase [Burkholderia gladioli]